MKALNNIPKWITATALLAIGGTVKKHTGYDDVGRVCFLLASQKFHKLQMTASIASSRQQSSVVE